MRSQPAVPAMTPRLERSLSSVPSGEVSKPVLDEHVVSVLFPHSYEADQYRMVRHFLDQTRATTGLKVVGVTSPAAGDGKTITAVNLAATLAQAPGTRVLLADGDLRRPLVASSVGIDPEAPGLAALLMDEKLELGAVVQTTPFNLDVLPAGPPVPDPYHALESARSTGLLEQARYSYDYVVLDTPPVLLVPDCRILSCWVDGFLVVVAAHRTPRKLLAETLNALEPAKVLGIVFNGDDRPLSGYYRQYGGYSYARPAARKPGWLRMWRGRGREGRLGR